jgi:HD-GYP domain-containing protein (c-di-GMP phosphodiesterase class II)
MSALAAVERENSRHVLVAVIDGNTGHRIQVTKALTSFYRVVDFADGTQALNELAATPPCVVLVDERAPPHGAPAVVRSLRNVAALRDVPVICTTASEGAVAGMREFADAYLEKPYRRSILIRTISGLVNRSVETGWDDLAPRHRNSLRQTIDVFNGISDSIERGEPLAYSSVTDACAPLVEAVCNADFRAILDGVRGHDNYSYVHSLRVGILLSLFGYTIGLKESDLTLLATGGLVHDIGKMSIPHEVLNKPGKLEASEWEVMKSHVGRSVDYLRICPDFPKGVLTIAAQHHEKLDGSGYPNGLTHGQLNELARMASIVDVFSALTDRRCYKDPMPPEQALSLMTGDMARGLDVHLLAMFREMLLDAASNTTH